MSLSDTDEDNVNCRERHHEDSFENDFLRTLSKLNDELRCSVTHNTHHSSPPSSPKQRHVDEERKCGETKRGVLSKVIHKIEDKLDLRSTSDSSSDEEKSVGGNNTECSQLEDSITLHTKKHHNKKPFQKVLRNIHLNNSIITRCIESTDALNKNYIHLLILLNDYIYDRLETNNTQLLIIFTHLNTYLVTTLHELSSNNVQSLLSVNDAFIDFFRKVNKILSDLWNGKCSNHDDLFDI